VPWTHEQGPARIEQAEIDYLCASVNRYLEREIGPDDVVHSYSGLRPLFDDGADNPSAVTRDYVLDLQAVDGAPLLSVFGGKITTYRKLAEHALAKLGPLLPAAGGDWTASEPLPGGDIPGGDFETFLADAGRTWPFLPAPTLRRLARYYGTRIATLLGDAASLADLGTDFSAGLHAREVDYLVAHEWAMTAEDVLWRRTKLGLHVEPGTAAALDTYLAQRGGRSGE
jgi:glycerol-3-phosphate dehydrogenase